jgi:uncharacterized protein
LIEFSGLGAVAIVVAWRCPRKTVHVTAAIQLARSSCVRAAAYDAHVADKLDSPSSVLASREHEDINRIADAHGARNVRVFGSVGRREANSSSDLDLLVDMADGTSLLDLGALGDDLEEALGVAVDVITEKSLSPYLRDRILAEAAIPAE